MIDKVKNFKRFVSENYKHSYYDSPSNSETFNPEYYLFSKLDGEGYEGDYNEFRNSDDYESYIQSIQNIIDEIKSLKFPLRIYRGLNEKEVDLSKFHQHESGNISWTYNLNVAKEFANGGVILTGVVNYDDVDIQTTINRNVLHSMLYEDEIVLKDNVSIKDLKQFNTVLEFLNEDHNNENIELLKRKLLFHLVGGEIKDSVENVEIFVNHFNGDIPNDLKYEGTLYRIVQTQSKELYNKFLKQGFNSLSLQKYYVCSKTMNGIEEVKQKTLKKRYKYYVVFKFDVTFDDVLFDINKLIDYIGLEENRFKGEEEVLVLSTKIPTISKNNIIDYGMY